MATARVAVVVGMGAMVGGGDDVVGARLVVVSSASEPRTWEMTREEVSYVGGGGCGLDCRSGNVGCGGGGG